MAKTTAPCHRGRAIRGQALTEFAILLPVVALFLLGIVELSGAFIQRMDLDAAVEQGARIAAIEGPGANCLTNPTNPQVDTDVINAVLGGKNVSVSNLQQIQVYRVNPDGTPDNSAVNTYVPPFTQDGGGGMTIPVSTTGNFNWAPCQRHNTEPSDSVGVAITYAYHPIVALPGFPTITLKDVVDQHINPQTGSTPCPIPGIPMGVSVSNASSVEPPPTASDSITWNAVPGASSYNIYANVNNQGYPSSPSMTVISATAAGGTQTVIYTNTTFAPTSYEVTGVNYCGEGQKSLPASNGQCMLPITPTILGASQAITMSTADLITYTAPWTSAPISSTYLITQTSGAALPVTFTIPISPGVPLTQTIALTDTGSDPIAYQMTSVNRCGVTSASSNTLIRVPVPAPPPAAGLVGWWRFDEGTGGSGATTADASGQGHTGTLSSGVMWTSGPTVPFTNALNFNGTSGYVSTVVGSPTNLPAANAAQSISWWMKSPTNPTGTQTIIALTNGTDSAVQPGLRLNNGVENVGVWQYSGAWLVATTPPTDGAWHHYVYTYDGTPGVQGTHRLYVDGAPVASSTVAPQSGTPTALQFGRWPGGTGGSGAGEYFQGALDDVRIYSRALSLAEVHSLDTQP